MGVRPRKFVVTTTDRGHNAQRLRNPALRSEAQSINMSSPHAYLGEALLFGFMHLGTSFRPSGSFQIPLLSSHSANSSALAGSHID